MNSTPLKAPPVDWGGSFANLKAEREKLIGPDRDKRQAETEARLAKLFAENPEMEK